MKQVIEGWACPDATIEWDRDEVCIENVGQHGAPCNGDPSTIGIEECEHCTGPRKATVTLEIEEPHNG